MQTPGSIPKFGLYGENQRRLQPGFVHIEDIATRSRRNDWIIEPHLHGKLFQLLCIENGDVSVRLDDADHRLGGKCLIVIPPGTVHAFSFSTDTGGKVLTLQESMLLNDAGHRHVEFDTLLEAPRIMRFDGETAQFARLVQYLALIQYEFDKNQSGLELMLGCLVKMVLMTLKRRLEQAQFESSGRAAGKQGLLLRFRSLLDENYHRHWKVQDYARALHTSTSSINRLCLKRVGVTAKTIIQDRLLMEIKRRLIYTREPLDSVAWSLGFKDPSYFSRFFKKQEGVTPSDYRKAKYFETGTT